MYRCNDCHRTFHVVAWLYSRYLKQKTGWERVYPLKNPNDKGQQEWTDGRMALSHLVRQPCCPFCFSLNLRKVGNEG